MANNGYQEWVEGLSDETCDMHRTITSLIEALQSIDFYNQRIDVCQDRELKGIFSHNRNEEIAHAVMLLTWIRKNDCQFEGQLKNI